MSDSATILRRKLAPSRKRQAPGGNLIEGLLRRSMPRDADELLSLDLLVSAVTIDTGTKSGLLDTLGAQDLIYLLESEAGLGVCTLTPGLVAGLIEVQMSGRVSERPPPDRAPTRTDGIIVSEIVDRWMTTALAMATEEGLENAWPLVGYRRLPGNFDKRNTDLALDPRPFHRLEIELSLGGGAKSGTLTFWISEAKPTADAETGGAAAAMRRHLPELPAPMRAILTRLPMGVGQARALAVDDIFEIPIASLNSVRLEGIGGKKIASGRLGQMNGQKAVRLLGAGGVGAVPGEGTLPDLADGALPPPAGDLPDLPRPGGGLADLPPMETAADLPNLPPLDAPGDLPELPPPDASAGLPDLPDLPELPDLPPLPD